IRLNCSDGTATQYQMDKSEWEFHEDSRVDAAVAPMRWRDSDLLRKYDLQAISTQEFLTDELIERFQITPGEELYFPGLFVKHPGNQSNIPILRTGTIAALPKEPVFTKRGLARGYLAELRSIGGHSGSPVFVHREGHEGYEINQLMPDKRPWRVF